MESNGVSRRSVFKLGTLAAAGIATGTLSGCGQASSASATSELVHGATGGGLKDTLDPHFPVTVPDIARVRNLYEPLLRFSPAYEVEPCLAEEIEPNADGTAWTFRLREDVTFHDGRPLTAADVQASIARMADPANVAPYMSDLGPTIDMDATRVMDERTYRLVLTEPNGIVDQQLAQYSLGIVPADFDLAHPVGTGPFKYEQFVPGARSVFTRHDDYWDTTASVDSLVIMNFLDDAAKVNALLAGQVHVIDNLPAYLGGGIESQGVRVLVSETGGWVPFTMRVDTAPFSDVRVRQAMRLIVDRQQMIDQALSGYGRKGNDLYSPFDPHYLGDQLPQRDQDIDQARALLSAAGYPDLQVELTASTAVGTGGVESANLFVQHAAQAGVQVRVNKADPNTFYGAQYLSWVFAQDFWSTRRYLPQAMACALPSSPYNETRFDDPAFTDLIHAARRTTDEARRRTLLQDAQRIEWERGGLLIWGFTDQVDGYRPEVHGLEPSREQPLSSFRFNTVRLEEQP